MKRSKMNPFAAMALLTAVVSFSASNALAVTYDAYIASTNPVGWWGMNETGVTTTTADLSGAYGAANNQAAVNLDLTYQGLGTNTISNQAGYVVSSGTNSAAYFDGTTNSGLYGHGAAPYDLAVTGAIYRYEPNGFAGEYWIKRDGDIAGLDSQRVVATREYGFGFRQSDSMLHFTTFGKVDYFSTVSLPSDGNWHQIGFSFDGNVTMSFYIDGVTAGTAVGANGGIRTALSPAANTINLGHRNTDSQHFKGTMDEAVLWGTQRTAEDFTASYLAATTAIPEPAAALLGMFGLFGLLRRRRN